MEDWRPRPVQERRKTSFTPSSDTPDTQKCCVGNGPDSGKGLVESVKLETVICVTTSLLQNKGPELRMKTLKITSKLVRDSRLRTVFSKDLYIFTVDPNERESIGNDHVETFFGPLGKSIYKFC